ncbi:MAG: HK97 gp10 family phage protein [Polaromonas sp.]|nr:HK97 gp10 family phage protein [Polaromonas sp.]
MGEFVQLTGFAELAKALRELPDRVARNGLRAAVNAGATVVKNQARKNAPVDTGLLKKNIFQKQIREASSQYQQTFAVGVRQGHARNKDGSKKELPYYWRFMEFGTSKMPARPFLRPAFEAKKEEAVKRIKEKLDERIQKYARDLAKK